MLRSATLALRSAILEAAEERTAHPGDESLLASYERLLADLNRIVEAIPFRHRVGLLRRNLIATFQQIFILRNLCQAMVCRLRYQHGKAVSDPPVGSFLDADARRAHRDILHAVADGWDRESWNVYDYL